MQKLNKKLFQVLLISFCLISKDINSQDFKINISKADSLYNAENYTEALEIYENELFTRHNTSPKKILKMARIHEGLENYANTLYYLNLYFKLTHDNSIQYKIKELSETHNLKGHSFDDSNFFISVISKYRKHIIIVLFIIPLVLLVLNFYNLYSKKQWSIGLAISTILLSIICFASTYYTKPYKYAIINNNNSTLMDSPSAGANLIEVVGEGHKVKVLGYVDIWTKIELEDKIAFIRSNNLIFI